MRVNWTAVTALLGMIALSSGLWVTFGIGPMLIVVGVLAVAIAVVDVVWQRR